MTSFDHLNATGSIHHLIRHFGNIETTIIAGERYISPEPTPDRRGLMAPGPAHRLQRRPGGLPGEQRLRHLRTGQAPDFVLEIASPSTGNRDVTEKRDGYAAVGIPEYWRFDPTGGQHHGAPLAGDRLVEGVYQPIMIEQAGEQTHQGYSAVLDLHLRWEQGELGWYDPAAGRHIVRFDDEREARLAAEARADTTEARLRELEAELERRRQP